MAMTDLLSRPLLRVKKSPPDPQRSVALGAMLGAAASAVAGVIVAVLLAVLAWFSADAGSFSGAIRVGALAWLVGNGAGLRLSDTDITAIPLGSCVLAGYVLYRAGRHVAGRGAVRSRRDVLVGAVTMSLTYAAAGTVTLALSGTGQAHAPLLRTLVATATLGLLFGGWGLARGASQVEPLLAGWPDDVRAVVSGAGAGVSAMVVAGGSLLAVSLVLHFSSAVTLAEGMHAGLFGGMLLTLVGLAVLPNAVLCAGAYVAGPGFVVGAGTAVLPGTVVLGRLPAFPLLAALPRSGGAGWQGALVVVPILAGVMAGLVAVHRFPVEGLARATVRGGLAGLAAGCAFGATTWLATGSVGPGRMQDIGPDVSATVLVCGIALAIGGAVAGAGSRGLHDLRARRRSAKAAL